MTSLVLTLLGMVIGTLVGESLLWRMFRRRVDPLVFPSESDESQVGFFGLGRMRAVAVVHALALGAWLVLSVLWLW